MNEKLYEQYLDEMSSLTGPLDHAEADSILCDLLTDLGYTEIVDIFYRLEKWYC